VTDEFKPVNKKKVFYSTDFSIQVLVQMKEIHTDTKIFFNWYREGSPDVLIGTYELSIQGKKTSPRFAVAGIEIPLLLSEKDNKSFQKWYVLIELDGVYEKKEFEIRTYSLYKSNSNSNLQMSIDSGREWKA
jgi:hypothetical protein